MPKLRKDITYEKVWSLYRDGHTTREIADLFGCATETVLRRKQHRARYNSEYFGQESDGLCECCKLTPKHPGFRKLCYACYTGVKCNLFDYDFIECT